MRQMRLVSLFHSGPLIGCWRHPESENHFLDPQWWAGLARTLEEARFDAMFFADAQTFYNDEMTRKGGDIYMLDPIPLAMTVANATRHLGIGITISASLFEPYGVARAMGTLDVLSGGRMAWNVVTSVSDQEAQRFSLPALLPKDERYDRADEMVEACMKLWDSFQPDAYVADKKSGTFMDPAKLRHFAFEGRYFQTRGPLTVPPSPQGRPVIMQAGSSERGRQFAAKWAEILFTFQSSLEPMQAFYKDMRRRLVQAGRPENACAILPSILPVVGETEKIAREKLDYIYTLIDDDVALARTSMAVGSDLSRLGPHDRLTDLTDAGGSRGALDTLIAAAAGENLTVIEAARRYALNAMAPQLVGTAEQIADRMQYFFENHGCDGFMLTPATMPGGFEDFARAVVPVLQERGLFRTEYRSGTLRGNVALD